MTTWGFPKARLITEWYLLSDWRQSAWPRHLLFQGATTDPGMMPDFFMFFMFLCSKTRLYLMGQSPWQERRQVCWWVQTEGPFRRNLSPGLSATICCQDLAECPTVNLGVMVWGSYWVRVVKIMHLILGCRILWYKPCLWKPEKFILLLKIC